MSDDRVLINGQWLPRDSKEALDAMIAAGVYGAPKPIKKFEPPAPKTATGYDAPGNGGTPVQATPSGTEDEKSDPGQDGVSGMDVQEAVYDKRTGDIVYQETATEKSRKLGIYTTVNSIKNNPNLSQKQKDQLIAYVKAHPEQQHPERTEDEAPKPFTYDTGPSDSIMLTDDQGISRPAVKNAEGKYEIIGVPDPFEAGEAVNERQADAVNENKPFVMPWMIGNALGRDIYYKAAVLEPGMMVYPMPADVSTIYPENIPLSMDLNPKSGYYAVGVEGTLQPNIYYDPVSGRFYNRFISEPMQAIDVMVYTPEWQGGRSGVQVMEILIGANMQHDDKIEAPAPLPGYSGNSDFTIPDFGTIDNKGRYVSSMAPVTGSQDAQNVTKNLGLWGMDLAAGIQSYTAQHIETYYAKIITDRYDIAHGYVPGTSKQALYGVGDAASMLFGGTVTAAGAVGYAATGGISAQNLTRGVTEGLPVMAYNVKHDFKVSPVRAGVGYGLPIVAGIAGGKVVGKVVPVSDPMLTGVRWRSYLDTVSMSQRAKALTKELASGPGADYSAQARAGVDIMRVADTTRARNPVAPEPGTLRNVPPELQPAIEETFANAMTEQPRVYGGATQNQAMVNEFRASKDIDVYARSSENFNEVATSNINRQYPGLAETSGNSVQLTRDFQSTAGLYPKGTKILDVHDARSPETGLSNVLPAPRKSQIFKGGRNYDSPISSESLQSYGTMRKSNALLSNLLEIKQQGGSHRFVKDFGDLIEYSKETMFTYRGWGAEKNRARIQTDIDTLLNSKYTYKPYPEGGEMASTPVTKTGMEIYLEYLSKYSGADQPIRVNLRPIPNKIRASPTSRSPSPISPSLGLSLSPSISPKPSKSPSPGPSRSPISSSPSPFSPSPVPPSPSSSSPSPFSPSPVPPSPSSSSPSLFSPSPVPPAPSKSPLSRPPSPFSPATGDQSKRSKSPDFDVKKMIPTPKHGKPGYVYKNDPESILRVTGRISGKIKMQMMKPEDIGFNIKGKSKKKRGSVFDI